MANWLVTSMRRAFIGAIQRAASKSRTEAAQRARQLSTANCVTGATALRPSISATATSSGATPNGETTPTPVITIGCIARVRYHRGDAAAKPDPAAAVRVARDGTAARACRAGARSVRRDLREEPRSGSVDQDRDGALHRNHDHRA